VFVLAARGAGGADGPVRAKKNPRPQSPGLNPSFEEMEETIGALEVMEVFQNLSLFDKRATHGAILAQHLLRCSKIHRIFWSGTSIS
jgi:hypothetical protein